MHKHALFCQKRWKSTHLLVALLLRPESVVHRLQEEVKVWEIVQPVSPPRSDVGEPRSGHSCWGKLAHQTLAVRSRSSLRARSAPASKRRNADWESRQGEASGDGAGAHRGCSPPAITSSELWRGLRNRSEGRARLKDQRAPPPPPPSKKA